MTHPSILNTRSMHIKLRNFRCHASADFDIPDDGLVLLSGESGAGKSTILQAIIYALYGNVRKPYTHGKTTCSVEVDIRGMKITRTSRPTRLLVEFEGTEYEDESAQGIIDTVMDMNEAEFMASSYIVQNTDSSVLSMTPTEQKNFVQTLAFSDNVHTEYRERIKAQLAEKKEGVTAYRSRAGLLQSQYEEARDAVEEVAPVTATDGEVITSAFLEDKIETCQAQIEEVQSSLELCRDHLEDARSYEANRRSFEDKIAKLGTEIAQLRQLKSGLDAVPESDEIRDLEYNIEMASELSASIKQYAKYTTQLAEFGEARSQYFEEMDGKLVALEKQSIPSEELEDLLERQRIAQEGMEKSGEVNVLKRRKEEATAIIKKTFKSIQRAKLVSKTVKKPGVMIAKLEEKEVELKANLARVEGARYVCPGCDECLVVCDNELMRAPYTEEGDVAEIMKASALYESAKRWRTTLEKHVDDYSVRIPEVTGLLSVDELGELSTQIEQYKAIARKCDTLRAKISSETLPVSLEKWEENVAKLEIEDPQYDGDIEAEISSLEDKLERAISAQSAHSAFARDIENKNKSLRAIEAEFALLTKEADMPNLEYSIGQYTQQLQDLCNQVSQYQKTLKAVSRYEEYEQDLSRLKKLHRKALKAQSVHDTFEAQLKGAMGLDDASRQAEVLAVNQTIESINEHARAYLERFFSEPISVRLENVKKNKTDEKVKLQMNVSINYKGETYDSIDQLSGGERQRANLAFILGVSDMLGSKILLLDECLNNLSADLNSDVLMYLHDEYLADADRLVMVVSHEAVQGLFDEIVCV